MSNNGSVNKSKKIKETNNSQNSNGSGKNKNKKKSKITKKKSKASKTLSSEDKEKLINTMNEFQTTLVKITKSFETINLILGKIV